jgi:uncharacterized protein YfiM (DUF2279 family)
MLPAFLTGDPLHPSLGSRWVTLADLALNSHAGWDEPQRAEIGFVFDLSPSVHDVTFDVLPRGSTLRLVELFWEMWGYGYLAGIFFDLFVEDGLLAGRTVTVGDYSRDSWGRGVPRRTLAAALIVPAGDPAIRDPAAARERYERIVQILRDIGTPTTRSDGAPCEPISVASDLDALGARPFV